MQFIWPLSRKRITARSMYMPGWKIVNNKIFCLYIFLLYRLGNRVVSVLDSRAGGPGFKSQQQRCRVTILGKLFTPIVPLFTKQQNW